MQKIGCFLKIKRYCDALRQNFNKKTNDYSFVFGCFLLNLKVYLSNLMVFGFAPVGFNVTDKISF